MRKFSYLVFCALLLPSLAFVACSSEEGDDTPEQAEEKPESDGKLVDGKSDTWNASGNPARFQVDLVRKLADLPREGVADQKPWPDTYWPTYEDSSNVRWRRGQATDEVDGLSPMEKFDMAFNGWTPPEGFYQLRPFNPDRCGAEDSYDMEYYEQLGPAAKWMTQNKGMYRMVDGVDNDRDGKTDECPISGDEENDDYDGVQSWWGLCHAWVPAAILEPEPGRAVTYNGVTFHVADMKGLMQTLYDKSDAVILGGRCNQKKVELDELGRAVPDECRDTNPGAFHLIVANMLGRHKRAFAEDRTWDFQVWNQPILKFETLAYDDGLTAAQANSALGFEGDEYHFVERYEEQGLDKPVSFAKVRIKLYYITESHALAHPVVHELDRYTRHDVYDYILELNKDGEITGGEWIGDSREAHPDFLWLPLRMSRSRWGANPHVQYDKVKMLIEMSLKPEEEEVPDGAAIKTFESDMEIPIPDNEATGISSVIDVPEDIEVTALKVELAVEHSYIGDLLVTLEKDGVQVTLHDRQGGGNNDLTESYTVSDFNGTSASGQWRLLVSDHAGQDVGKLLEWKLVVTTGAPVDDPSDVGVFTWNAGLEIPDDQAAGVSAKLNVDNEAQIGSGEIAIKLTHTYVGDLIITLTHSGMKQILHSREGGSADDLDKTYPLTSFGGVPMKGEWVLTVSDNAGRDLGTLDEWTLTLKK